MDALREQTRKRKRAQVKKKSRDKQILKDPKGTREKHAQIEKKSRAKQILNDPDGTRAKENEFMINSRARKVETAADRHKNYQFVN